MKTAFKFVRFCTMFSNSYLSLQLVRVIRKMFDVDL